MEGFDGRFFGGAFAVAGVIGFYLYVTVSLGTASVLVRPLASCQDMGYQTVQGLLAVGSWQYSWEKALCKVHLSTFTCQKHTDFAFAVWAQEMGFIRAVFVVLWWQPLHSLDSALLIDLDEFGKWL